MFDLTVLWCNPFSYLEGSSFGGICHGSATTTHTVRVATQRPQFSFTQQSKAAGINTKTVAKQRKRATVAGLRTGPDSDVQLDGPKKE